MVRGEAIGTEKSLTSFIDTKACRQNLNKCYPEVDVESCPRVEMAQGFHECIEKHEHVWDDKVLRTDEGSDMCNWTYNTKRTLNVSKRPVMRFKKATCLDSFGSPVKAQSNIRLNSGLNDASFNLVTISMNAPMTAVSISVV